MTAMPLGSFENQGLLAIDGTRGIAPAVILLAAQRNARVVFTARPGLEAAAEEIVAQAQATGVSDLVSYVISDMVDEDAVERLVDTALERLPGLNVLIHNLESAAISEHKPLVEISLAEWTQVLSTELHVPFMLARRAVEEFLFAQVPGRIVYIAYSGLESAGNSAHHAAAQAGLRGLVRCITKEFGRRELACNAVTVRSTDATQTPSGLVETALFLASREASFVNGEFFDISSISRRPAIVDVGRIKAHVKG